MFFCKPGARNLYKVTMPTERILPAKPFTMIRHGQTVANAAGIASGSVDTPLTDLGRTQAIAVRPLLAQLDLMPTIIIHSALSRARDTALLLNQELCVPLTERGELGERNFGAWAGQPWPFVAEHLHARRDPPEGELNTTFLNRVAHALRAVLMAHNNPLIVTHGGVFDALAELYDGRFEDVHNCALYAFEPHHKESIFPWDVWHYTLGADEIIAKTPVYLIFES